MKGTQYQIKSGSHLTILCAQSKDIRSISFTGMADISCEAHDIVNVCCHSDRSANLKQ